jgi:gas vesicle protein
MNGGFTKGLIVGGIVGASVSMMMNNDTMKGRSRRKMMRSGKSILRNTGTLVGDIVEMFR